jgi:hypothetical protein
MRPRSTWLLVALLGCGTPSRHLTTRVVDDPMVLPRRMLSMGLAGEFSQRPWPQFFTDGVPMIDYGLSDRLELASLLSLRWAILDDAPLPLESLRRPDRLSLAVRAGAHGMGLAGAEGFLILPVASVEVRKHLGERTLVSLTALWDGKWVEDPVRWFDSYGADLFPHSSRLSQVTVAVEVFRQLGDHVALGAGAGTHQIQRCTLPSCDWAARGGELWVGPNVRPWRWLTLALHLFGGGRYRPAGHRVQSPDEQLVFVPSSVSWLGTRVTVSFNW